MINFILFLMILFTVKYEKLEVNVLTLTEEKAQLQEELEFIKGNSTNGKTILH